MLNGRQIGELRDILCQLFDRNELIQFMSVELEENVGVDYEDTGSFRDLAFDVVQGLGRKDKIGQLVVKLRGQRPENRRLAAFETEFNNPPPQPDPVSEPDPPPDRLRRRPAQWYAVAAAGAALVVILPLVLIPLVNGRDDNRPTPPEPAGKQPAPPAVTIKQLRVRIRTDDVPANSLSVVSVKLSAGGTDLATRTAETPPGSPIRTDWPEVVIGLPAKSIDLPDSKIEITQELKNALTTTSSWTMTFSMQAVMSDETVKAVEVKHDESPNWKPDKKHYLLKDALTFSDLRRPMRMTTGPVPFQLK